EPPVDRHHDGAAEKRQQRSPISEHGAHLVPAPHCCQQNQTQRQGTQKAPSDELERIHALDQDQVERHRTPDGMSPDRIRKAASNLFWRMAHGRSVRLVRPAEQATHKKSLSEWLSCPLFRNRGVEINRPLEVW